MCRPCLLSICCHATVCYTPGAISIKQRNKRDPAHPFLVMDSTSLTPLWGGWRYFSIYWLLTGVHFRTYPRGTLRAACCASQGWRSLREPHCRKQLVAEASSHSLHPQSGSLPYVASKTHSPTTTITMGTSQKPLTLWSVTYIQPELNTIPHLLSLFAQHQTNLSPNTLCSSLHFHLEQYSGELVEPLWREG